MPFKNITLILSVYSAITLTACSADQEMSRAATTVSPPVVSTVSYLHPAMKRNHTTDAADSALTIEKGAIRLRDGRKAYMGVYARLHTLGRIRSITQNNTAILECIGEVTQASLNEKGRIIPGTGFAGGAIDLRFNVDKWGSAFAVVPSESNQSAN